MQAMIFAAGLGTRLKPLTDRMPKALVPVAGKPLLQHVLDKLQQPEVEKAYDECFAASSPTQQRIVVNVHHFADQIIDYLKGTDILISDERNMLLETGGGLLHASRLFSGWSDGLPVLIHNVDILSNLDIAELFRHAKGFATLVVSERKTQRYLLFDDGMRLVGWTNILTGEVRSPYGQINPSEYHMYAFSGIHLISPHLFPVMQSWPERFSIIDFYLSVCGKFDIHAFVPQNLRLMDVGKLDTLDKAQDFLASIE